MAFPDQKNMVSLFDIPPCDVLFEHIFVNLETTDVWTLRLTCRKLHELCWDYFCNACKSLKVNISIADGPGRSACSSLDIGAGINIMCICKCLQTLEITGCPAAEVHERGFVKLLSLLLDSEVELKQLKLKNLNLTIAVPLLDGISKKCCNLQELEFCHTVINVISAQHFVSEVLHCSRNSLRMLTLKYISFSPNLPLPTISMTSLHHFSVSPSSCDAIIIYDFICCSLSVGCLQSQFEFRMLS